MADNGKKLQLDIDSEMSRGIYANLALIVHSPSEFIIDFAQLMPGMNKAKIASRVVLAPEHAKRLLLALQDNLYKYEQLFGQIQLHSLEKAKTIAPFSSGNGSGNKGEA